MSSTTRRRNGQGLLSGLVLLAGVAMVSANAWGTNPVPQINQLLVPASTPAGGTASFTLTINGCGFVQGSVVYWNSTVRQTMLVSSTQVTATISPNLFSVGGTASVKVVNPAPGGGTSNVVFFQVTSPATQVSLSASSATVSSNPLALATADFNGDRNKDLAVSNEGSNTVSILLGNGNGTFQSHVDYATGAEPAGMAAGDFNRDGTLDLAVADESADTVSILLGNGNSTFGSHVDYATGQFPVQVVTGDFNQDGNLDVAVVNQQASTVSILLGNGDGTFQTHVDYAVGSGPMAIATADLSGDDKLDLAVADSVTQAVSVLIGNGDGTFQSAIDYPAPVDPVALVAADFNRDGKLDLAVAGLVSSSVAILLGNGDGTFQSAVDYTTGAYPESVATGDFNGDGLLDLALATDSALGSASVLLGNGDGTFQNVVDFSAGLLPTSISTGDFNGDGKLDLAAADFNGGSVSVMLETTILWAPAGLTFASQNLGTTSAAQTVTLTNIGSQSVNVTSIATAAPYAESNTCNGSLGAGSSCSVSVTFTPTVPGASSVSLTITDSAVGSPQVVSLTGTGTGPAVSLSPASLSFGSVNVGTRSPQQVVTLTNTGNATLDITSASATGPFILSNRCGSTLAARANCKLNVEFAPTTIGTATGTLSIADNALASPQTVSLTGVGLAPVVTLSPTSLTFATQLVNTTSPSQSVTLTNTGTAALTITNVTTNSSFSESNNCGSSVGAGASCILQVTFTPSRVGTITGNLKVFDNAAGSPQIVTLSGVGTAIQLSPASLNFGTVEVGQSSNPQNVTMTNVGSARVTITSITITGSDPADFSDTTTCGKSLNGGASCTISVTFTPTVTGARSASVSVADSSGGSPQTVALSGTGD